MLFFPGASSSGCERSPAASLAEWNRGLCRGDLGDQACRIGGEIQPQAAELPTACSGLEREPACSLPPCLPSPYLFPLSLKGLCWSLSVRPELSHRWGRRPEAVGLGARSVPPAGRSFELTGATLALSFFSKPLVLKEKVLVLPSYISTEFCFFAPIGDE